jgi:hypothetical protein
MLRSKVLARFGPLNRWRYELFNATYRAARQANPVSRLCNICGYTGYFFPFGRPVRPEAACPQCSSLERHRNIKLWFDQNSQLFHSASVLHFAPEVCVTRFVKPAAANKYITADLDKGHCDLSLNIENIELPDHSFDIVICSHVLEHVDDRPALSELHRVIKPNGSLILLVPIIEGWETTYEDSSIQTGQDRELHFGQSDHVRIYGADIRQRIAEAGFTVREYTAVEPYVARHGLLRGDKIFVAGRSAS